MRESDHATPGAPEAHQGPGPRRCSSWIITLNSVAIEAAEGRPLAVCVVAFAGLDHESLLLNHNRDLAVSRAGLIGGVAQAVLVAQLLLNVVESFFERML